MRSEWWWIPSPQRPWQCCREALSFSFVGTRVSYYFCGCRRNVANSNFIHWFQRLDAASRRIEKWRQGHLMKPYGVTGEGSDIKGRQSVHFLYDTRTCVGTRVRMMSRPTDAAILLGTEKLTVTINFGSVKMPPTSPNCRVCIAYYPQGTQHSYYLLRVKRDSPRPLAGGEAHGRVSS
jgi:hypothetical protein